MSPERKYFCKIIALDYMANSLKLQEIILGQTPNPDELLMRAFCYSRGQDLNPLEWPSFKEDAKSFIPDSFFKSIFISKNLFQMV